MVVSRLLRHTLLSGLGALGSSSSGFWPSRQSILHCGGPSDLPSGSQSLHIDLAASRFRPPISSIPGVTELNVFQFLAFFIDCK